MSTVVKHIYQTPHNQQTVSKGVREKRCLLPWITSTKQSANSQQEQSANTVSRNSQQTKPAMRLSSNSVHATIMCNKQLSGYTAATNATICHYHRRHSFPPPPLCAVAADTAAATDRAPSLPPLLAAAGTAVAAEPPYLLQLPSEE